MENKRKIALALFAAAALGFAGVAWNDNAEHGADDGHGHAAAKTAKDDHGHDEEEGHAEEGEGGHAEEGKLTLDARQIQAAGIEVEAAAPRELGSVVSFPGEIRFDEDRTAHVVPRVPGVVESVSANLGETVKKGQLLAVIASQQMSDLRSEQQLSLIHI